MLASAIVPAQDPSEPARPALLPPVATLDADGVRAEGELYRATMSPDGFRFEPALGMTADSTRSLHLRMESIGRGSGEFSTALPVGGYRLDGLRAALSRVADGNSVEERYDAMPSGVEQSFLIAGEPRGEGDLIIRMALATDLPVPAEGRWDRLDFMEPERGGIQIGSITAIDATGRRCRGHFEHHTKHVDIVVPGDFVDSAAWPLLVDPLIGTVVSGTNGWDDDAPDAAWSETLQEWLIVWRRSFSFGDGQIRALRLDGAGRPIGSFFVVTSTPGVLNTAPSVVWIRAAGRYFVAWERSISIFGPDTLMCASVDPIGRSTSAALTLRTLEPHDGDLSRFAIRESRRAGLAEAIVATRQHLTRVSVSAVGVSAVASRNVAPDVVVAMNRAGESRFVVAAYAFGHISSLGIRAYDWDLNPVTPFVPTVDPFSRFFLTQIALDGDDSHCVLAFVQVPILEGVVAGAAFRWSGSSFVAGSFRALTPGDRASRRISLAFAGPKFLLATRVRPSSQLNSYIELREIGLTDCVPCGPTHTLTAADALMGQPAIGSRVAGGANWQGASSGDQALVVFPQATLSSPFSGALRVQRWEAMRGGRVSSLGGGCGAGGTMQITSPAAIGNPDLRYELIGGQPGATGFLIVGQEASLTVTTCGPCSILSGVAWLPVGPVRPDGRLNAWMQVPCTTTLLGTSLQGQFATLTAGSRPCTPYGTDLSFSNRVRLTLDW